MRILGDYSLVAIERDEGYVEVPGPDGPEHRLVGRVRHILHPEGPHAESELVLRLPEGALPPGPGEYRLALVLIPKESR